MIHGHPRSISDARLGELEVRKPAAGSDVPALLDEVRRLRHAAASRRAADVRQRFAVLAATGCFLIAAAVSVFPVGGWVALGGALLALSGAFVLGWLTGGARG
jgi:hypothetical protein